MRILALLFLLSLVAAAARADHLHIEEDCHDGTCITEHEWSQLDWKWQILRDISLGANRNGSSANLRTLWESFSDLSKEINFNRRQSLSNGNDAKQLDESFTRKLVKAFHRNRNQARELETPIGEIVKNHAHDGTRYDKQIILVLEPDDRVVSEAAINLYNKHPSKSAVAVRDKSGKLNSLIRGRLPTLTRYSRVQVVGHGRSREGKMFIGGLTGTKLADLIAKLPGAGNGKIRRISLVGCNIAKTTSSEVMPLGDDTFLCEFMNALKFKHILTEVSARNTFVQVNAEGRKMVGELVTPDGMKWNTKDHSKKFVYSFDREGKLTSKMVPATERIGSFPGVDKVNDEMSLMVGNEEEVQSVPVDNDAMDDLLTRLTSKTFKDSNRIFIREALIQNKVDVEKHFKVKLDKVTNGFSIELVKGKSVRISFGRKKLSLKLDVGSSVQNMYVWELVNNKWVVKDRWVRVINSLEEMVGEINWLGLNGISNTGEKNLYYRFGDFIISLDLNDFYATFHGYVASKNAIEENKIGKIITKPGKEFKTNHPLPARPDPATNKFSYANLKEDSERAELDTLRWCFDNWYKGGQRTHDKIAGKKPSPRAAVLIFAISISESVRNFRTHIFNVMALQMLSRCTPNFNMKKFLDGHSMACGGTWPDKKRTGFQGLNEMNEKKVRPKELDLAWRWRRYMDPKEEMNNDNLETLYFDAIANDEVSELPVSDNSGQPLGDLDEIIERAGTMQSTKRSLDIKSFSQRALSAVAADHAYLSQKIAEIVKSKSLPGNFKLGVDSLIIKDGVMRFSMVNENDPDEQIELSGEFDHMELQTHNTAIEMDHHISDIAPPLNYKVHQANVFFSVYGIVFGLEATIQAFEGGNTSRGFLYLSQSLYGIGEMTGWNKAVSKAAGKAFVNIFKEDVANLKGVIERKLRSQVVEGLSKTAGRFGGLLDKVPFLGLAFGISNIVEDFMQHNTLGYIDAALDIAQVGLSILGPEAELAMLAVTSIRMAIGDFYKEIDNAMNKLPKDANLLQKVFAIVQALTLGLKDILLRFTLIGNIINAISQSRELDKRYNRDRKFLHSLADYHNYFKVEKVGNITIVNFVDGSSSKDGGDITFRLHDNGTLTLTMKRKYDEDGNPRTGTTTQTFNVSDVTGIVAGIGEAHNISFKIKSVKMLFLIPVNTKRVISELHGDRNSLHGTYYGNSKDNQFYTVQHLPDGNKLDYTLGDYFYDLYGMDGNDIFYLGPQKTNVHGGEGSDTYVLQEHGGHTHIDNYAVDMKGDLLILNSTDFQTLSCGCEGYDLYISNRGYSHHVQVTNWFLGDRYRHLNFLADNGVLFEVRASAFGIPRLVAITIDGSKDESPQSIDTRQPPWMNVVVIHGSNFSDTIVGNDQGNKLDGGNGTDHLTGGNGKDIYIVDAYDTGNDVINNCADDTETDTLYTGFKFLDTVGKKDELNLQLKDKNSNRFIRILDWFKGPNCQHMTYLSTDGVAYKLSTDDSLVGDAPIYASLIDRENMSSNQTINTKGNSDFSNAVSIIGSNYSDTIIGNTLDNYIFGGRGDDVIRGGDGADTYVIREGHGSDTIINLSFDRKPDTLLLGFNFSDVTLAREGNDMIVICKVSTRCAKFKDWFKSDYHQHLRIRTIDGVVSRLPRLSSDSLVLTPVVIDRSTSETGVAINSNVDPWRAVQIIVGSNFSDVLLGNEEANYLDPQLGGSKLVGGNGSDTYIIRQGYGTNNTIDNFAVDKKTDILSFEADYSDIMLGDRGSSDILLSCRNSTAVTLSRFKEGSSFQHLFIQSGDGIGFTLTPKHSSGVYQATPLLINKAKSLNHQKIDLRSSLNWTEVKSVKGSSNSANHIQGQGKDNILVGGSKVDSLNGGAGDDILRGGDGENVMDGGLGDDTLIGGKDVDWMLGGLGDDLIYGGYGADKIDGGPGSDTVLFTGNPVNRTGVYVDLHYGNGFGADAEGDIYIRVENIYGTPYDDVLIGNNEDNTLSGEAGNDVIYPGNGTDLLIGGEGHDVYIIDETTGVKTIQNFARDTAEDVLTLLSVSSKQLKIEQYAQIATIGGPLAVKQWHRRQRKQLVGRSCFPRMTVWPSRGNLPNYFLSVVLRWPTDTFPLKTNCLI